MDIYWSPEIKRKRKNRLPNNVLLFFHEILTLIETDEKCAINYNWQNCRKLKKKIKIESDTKNKKIQIPDRIELGTVYFKESDSKAKNFLKSLRDAFAHNYIEVIEDGIIRIALPFQRSKKIKLACNLDLLDLKDLVLILKN